MASHHLVREARRRAALSQAELGERAGKAASAISRWERAGNEPSLANLRQVIRAAGFDLVIGIATADEHDLGLIRRSLALAPEERLRDLVSAVRSLESMVSSA